MTRCRPVPQHTMFMAGKVCFSYVFKKNRSSPTTSLNTQELGERLTIGPAGRSCASQAPQLCLAAARMNLRLAPPRRNTRVCNESDKDCSVSSSWSSCAVCFFWKILHLPRVPELWLEKRHKLSLRHVCGCSMHVVCMLCAFLLMFFLSCPRCSYDATHRLCRPSLG